jgi:hypothetical protein
MPQVMQFFQRQAVNGGPTTLHSEVYEVSDYSQIVTELRIYFFSGAGTISAVLQDCMDPTFAPDTMWRDVTSQALAITGSVTFSGSGLLRFARMNLTVPTGVTGAILSVEGEGREKT